MKTTITHGTCGIEMTCHTDYISVRNADGEHLGHIYSADPAADWEKITHGACPICDGWEDGLGHACTADGWELGDPSGAVAALRDEVDRWVKEVDRCVKEMEEIKNEEH